MDLTYNNITLSIVKTNSVARTPIFTSDGTQYLYDHIYIDVNAIINPIFFDGLSPAQADAKIRHALTTPRGRLIFGDVTTGFVLYASPPGALNDPVPPPVPPGPQPPGAPFPTIPPQPPGAPCDANNGPRPISYNIVRVDGVKTYHVNFKIETWLMECDKATSALLSNRFSQEHHINQQHLTMIVTRGDAQFRTDILDTSNKVADNFRNLLFQATPPGFHRVSADVVADPARNRLSWTTTDEERPYDLGETDARRGGSGIVFCEAVYSTGSVSGDGGVATAATVAAVDVSLMGNKFSSTWRLTQAAFQIAATKLPLGDTTHGVLQAVSIRQYMTDRKVQMHVEMRLNGIGEKELIIGPLVVDALKNDDSFADKQGVNPGLPEGKGSRGSFNGKLLAAALYDACVKPYDPNPGESVGETSGFLSNYGGPPPAVKIRFGDVLPTFKAKVKIRGNNFFTDYKIDIRHDKHYQNCQLPIASPPPKPAAARAGAGGVVPVNNFYQGSPPDPTSTNAPPAIVPTCEVIYLAQPTSIRTVQFTAERVNQVPTLPIAYPYDPNLVLLSETITAASPVLLPDGFSVAMRVSGVYTYALRQALGAGDYLPMGILPWMDFKYPDFFISQTDFEGGLIDSRPDTGGDGNGSSTGAGPPASYPVFNGGA